MASRSLCARCAFALLAIGLFAAVAEAQQPTARPFRRLFGGRERPNATQRLYLQVSGAETYNTNLLDSRTRSDDRDSGGHFPSGSMTASYRRAFGDAVLNATGGLGLQYYPSLDGRTDQNQNAGLDFTLPLDHLTLRVAQTLSHATFSTLLGLPGSVIPDAGSLPTAELLNPTDAYSTSASGGWQSNSHASASYQWGRRSSLEGRYSYAQTALGDIESTFYEAGFRSTYTVTRDASIVAGYSYHRGDSATAAQQAVVHDIDLGLAYSRRLPGLRNTTMSFTSGSSVVNTLGGREFRISGDARLVHLIGRTWTTAFGYQRGTQFMSALGQFVVSDSTSGTLNGFLSPRAEVWVSAAATRGNVGLEDGTPLRSYTGAARLQFALSRRLALDTQYMFYKHAFGANPELPASLLPSVQRNAIRVGLTLLIPILH